MKRFAIAFSIGLLAFALANLAACFLRSDNSDDPDATERWGFPFLVSETLMMPDVPPGYFSRTSLWGDMIVALLTSALGAGIYAEMSRRERRNPFCDRSG
jgi:hypothetical protein